MMTQQPMKTQGPPPPTRLLHFTTLPREVWTQWTNSVLPMMFPEKQDVDCLCFFFSMLNVAATNSYIIHLTNNREKLCRKYLRQLANALMKESIERRAPIPL